MDFSNKKRFLNNNIWEIAKNHSFVRPLQSEYKYQFIQILFEEKMYIKVSGGEKWASARAVSRDVYLSYRICNYKTETRILMLSVTESWELYQKCTFVRQGWREGFALFARKCESKHQANVDSRTPIVLPSYPNPTSEFPRLPCLTPNPQPKPIFWCRTNPGPFLAHIYSNVPPRETKIEICYLEWHDPSSNNNLSPFILEKSDLSLALDSRIFIVIIYLLLNLIIREIELRLSNALVVGHWKNLHTTKT